jgi:epoxide hydrolase 4
MTDTLLKPGWRSHKVQAGEVMLHLVEAGPADGVPVLLLHGFPEFWWAWRHLLDPLAAAGFRAIAPDLRGYNLSDVPSGIDAYRTERLAGDVLALADALGIGRFRLVGHDWGGITAWMVAAQAQERLERLAIMDAPHPGVWTRFMTRHPGQALRSAYVGWFQLPLLPETALRAFDFAALRSTMRMSARRGVFDTSTLDLYAQAWRKPGRLTAMLNYYRALPRSSRRAPERLDTPTLILWGSHDSFLDTRLAQESTECCANGRALVLPDATHWLHLEQPDRVASELIAFLKA